MRRCQICALFVLLFLAGSGVRAQAELVVASFSTVLSDFAKNVGGSHVRVISIIKPGVDPHEFQPTPLDIQQVTTAKLVLMSGKGMEGYLAKLQESSPNATFLDCGSCCNSLQLEDGGRKIEDPHWWHSIANAKAAVDYIEAAFIHADPTDKGDFEANAARYQGQLEDLDDWAKEEVTKLPRSKRKLVTSHDAFQYFARDFGFTIYPIEGVSTEDEPSSKKVAELIDLIKSQDVKAVFFENIENPKVLTEITRESGAKVGGELYADGLGDKEATTYIDMEKHNITTIVESLL